MAMLAIDTATRWTGLALHNGAEILAELGWKTRFMQTVELSSDVDKLLTDSNLNSADLTGITVAIGPGSYTSLRVGLAFAKGFALVHNLPLIGVFTLDIVASSFGQSYQNLVVVADAGRGRVCGATYKWIKETGWTSQKDEDIYSWSDLLEKSKPGTSFAGEITPDARKLIHEADKSFYAVSPAVGARRAGYLAEIGFRRWKAGNVDDAASLVPIYLREPGGEKSAKNNP